MAKGCCCAKGSDDIQNPEFLRYESHAQAFFPTLSDEGLYLNNGDDVFWADTTLLYHDSSQNEHYISYEHLLIDEATRFHLYGDENDPRQMCEVTAESNLSRILLELSMPEMGEEQIITTYLLKTYCHDVVDHGINFGTFDFTKYWDNCFSSCLCRYGLKNVSNKSRLIDFTDIGPPPDCLTNEEYGFETLTDNWTAFIDSIEATVKLVGGDDDIVRACGNLAGLAPLEVDCF